MPRGVKVSPLDPLIFRKPMTPEPFSLLAAGLTKPAKTRFCHFFIGEKIGRKGKY